MFTILGGEKYLKVVHLLLVGHKICDCLTFPTRGALTWFSV